MPTPAFQQELTKAKTAQANACEQGLWLPAFYRAQRKMQDLLDSFSEPQKQKAQTLLQELSLKQQQLELRFNIPQSNIL